MRSACKVLLERPDADVAHAAERHFLDNTIHEIRLIVAPACILRRVEDVWVGYHHTAVQARDVRRRRVIGMGGDSTDQTDNRSMDIEAIRVAFVCPTTCIETPGAQTFK